jgi:glycerol-3-phosphate dehydrogenase (NAD(P)+)
MTRFGEFYGAKKDTFLGLSGAGDLFLTATSVLSRNYRVGLGLAKNRPLAEILDALGEVAEGVYTTEAVYKIVQKKNIYTPIANEIYHILEGKDVHESLRDLLNSSSFRH